MKSSVTLIRYRNIMMLCWLFVAKCSDCPTRDYFCSNARINKLTVVIKIRTNNYSSFFYICIYSTRLNNELNRATHTTGNNSRWIWIKKPFNLITCNKWDFYQTLPLKFAQASQSIRNKNIKIKKEIKRNTLKISSGSISIDTGYE